METTTEITAEWLQYEVLELLGEKHGQLSDAPKCMVGVRGSDLIVLAPDGEQYVILFERAR